MLKFFADGSLLRFLFCCFYNVTANLLRMLFACDSSIVHLKLKPTITNKNISSRYLGTVIMIITSEAPAQVVGLLKSKTPRLTGVLFGHYRMTGQDRITAQVLFPKLCGKIFSFLSI